MSLGSWIAIGIPIAIAIGLVLYFAIAKNDTDKRD